MKQANEKYTILYARLSQDDGKDGVSESIENQQMILEKYATEHGFQNTKFLYDDGESGTTLNRPAWNEVMHLIESGKVSTLIIKDSSRLGRNYVKVGELIEDTLPMHGVRFISISENADSLYGLDDFMPFRAVMNELYAKDTSKKIKTVKKAKAQRGERIGSKPPYGYIKDESRKNMMKPDPYAAEVVRKIFKLCVDGRGPRQIANQLEEERVLNPTNYHFSETGIGHLGLNTDRPYHWSHKTVSRIIEDEVYLGHTILMKSGVISYKNKKKLDRPKDEWVKTLNTHEPIVTQDMFDIAQRVRQQKKRTLKGDEKTSILSGMLFCSDCGSTLGVQRYDTNSGKKISFRCALNRQDTHLCTSHSMAEELLLEVILDDLKRVTHFARQEEKLFSEYIQEKSSAEVKKEIKSVEKQIAKATKRACDLRKLLKKLYEDNLSGRLSDENFDILSAEYNLENRETAAKIPQLEQRLTELNTEVSSVDKFVGLAKKYTQIDTLTSEILRTFVERIEVGNKIKRHDSTQPQDVWIYYRGIGLLDGATKANDQTPPPYALKMMEHGIYQQEPISA